MALKIILVDDQPVYRNAIKTLLTKIGNVEIVCEASNGVEFLDKLPLNVPDLVFMDIEMPQMNGIEASRQALKKFPDLVIIGLSMYDHENYVRELLDAGARGYLLKLSDNTNILRTIVQHPKAEVFFSKELESYRTADPSDRPTTKKTVLIVDDLANTRFIVEFTLKQFGYEVIKAASGTEALEKVKGKKIDLMVTDFNMPGMDGLTLATEIKKIPEFKQVPILLLTTEKSDALKERAKTIGITGWIIKPFVIDQFIAVVKKAMK